jgi:cysteine synthase A
VPRLVTGQFDPTTQKAVWPSTGNYCRGGAYDSHILACDSVAILPEEMSRERFEWLAQVAGEVIATPGSESNVKEIFDKCWELRRSGEDVVIFNQFDEFGNYLWHYTVTGPAFAEVLARVMRPGDRYAGVVSATGSGGTIAAGDWLKQHYPASRVVASEALQCPTLLLNGFGAHRIEGIGDKHVPWIHNVRNTDLVVAIDDAAPMALLRLFNEEAGQAYLSQAGVPESLVGNLPLLGISSISNLLSAVKTARWYELGPKDVVVTVLTDSMDLYASRVAELRQQEGSFDATRAAVAHQRWLLGASTDHMAELGYWERKRLHNLKYFTWVEQQGKTAEELNALWDPAYWEAIQGQVPEIDRLIEEFNRAVG